MGLLTWILSRQVKKPKELARVIFRRKLLAWLLPICAKFSWVFFPIAILVIFLFPQRFFLKTAEPDEKALSIGQTTRELGQWDYEATGAQIIDNLRSVYHSHNREERHAFLKQQFESFGLKVSSQRFSVPPLNASGLNSYGLLKAPKADGTEAIIISAPWTCGDGQENIYGIIQLLSFAKFASKKSIWAKDLFFVVPDLTPSGSYAWLQSYHGLPETLSIKYDSLKYHAGIIQAAVNLEFCGPEEDFGGIGLYTVNVNGQLPNFDMVVTATLSSQYEGIPIYLHGLAPEYNDNTLVEQYLNKGKSLLSFLHHQALGLPDQDHAFYQKYKIEALTIKGHKHPNQDSLPAHRFGRVLECIMYSLNNLLERFHHALWFYLLAAADWYIPLAFYIGPVIALSVSLILYGLSLWLDEEIPDTKVDAKKEEELLNGKYYVRPAWVKMYSSKSRRLRGSLTVICKIFSVSWALFYSMDGFVFTFSKRIQSVTQEWNVGIDLLDMIPFVVYLVADQVFTSNFFAPQESYSVEDGTLKSLSCSIVGMMLVAVATINPSCSIVLALLLVPTLLLASRESLLSRLLNPLVSPTGLLVVYYLLMQVAFGQNASGFYRRLMESWWIHGSIAYPILFCLYYPSLLLAQVLTGLSLAKMK